MTKHKGRCHCGDVHVEFETALPDGDIPVRTCGCTFCQRARPIYASDSEGRVTLRHKPDALHEYRFGHESAAFVSCAKCGIFLGAMTETANGLRCVLNIAGANLQSLVRDDTPLMDFDSETPDVRDARRAKNWTPLSLVERA